MNGDKLSINDKLLQMLRCPIDGSPLAIADESTVASMNAAIAAGELRDRLDQKVEEPIDGALLTPDSKRAYLIRGGIPTMIADESVAL